MMQKREMPEWERTSCNTIKKDCRQVYEAKKKKEIEGIVEDY